MGPPAAGKSTYGKSLAAKFNATFLDIDIATEPVVRAGLKLAKLNPDDRDSALFKESFRDPIYDSLFAIASDNLENSEVVIVGPFTQESRQANWLEILESRFGANICAYFVNCRTEVRRQRMKARGNARDRAKLADWENYIQYYTDEKPPAFPHIYIDTNSPPV